MEHGSVRFERASGQPGPLRPPEAILLPGEGDFDLPGWSINVSVRTASAAGSSPDPRSASQVSLAGVSFPVRVRPRRDGDRLVPSGMKGSKKLSDIMIDAKVPLRKRGSVPVFEDGLGIIWVPGLATAERTRVTGPGRVTVFSISKKG